MKNLLFSLAVFLISLSTRANMASPIHRGSVAASPFISEFVDIEKEKILITPDESFQFAAYSIEYHIKASKSGIQIPLIFCAYQYKEDFKVWMDGQEVELKDVPESYYMVEGAPFSSFDYIFNKGLTDSALYKMPHPQEEGIELSYNSLKYFEATIGEGQHIIKVEYIAESWYNRSEWVKEYSLHYALFPAKYWKSFSNLEVTLDASKCKNGIITNLGKPVSGNLLSKAVWNFSSLPVDVINISYKPEVNLLANALIYISPMEIVVLAIALIVIHFRLIKKYRKRNPEKRFSPVMISGSFIVPFMVFFCYMVSPWVIDSVIGKDASNYHGYTFLIFIFYPVVMPFYLFIMWIADKVIKLEQ